MADLLPSSPDPSAGDGGEPKVIGVDSDDADDLLAALQSEMARDLLAALYDDPATPSELADTADTSIQNVRYHLDKLADADLVEVADTIYSEKGREMNVYAPAAKPLVVFAGGDDDDVPGLESALSELLGGLGILGLSSVVVQRLFGGPNALGGLVTDIEFQSGGSADSAATTEGQNANLSGSNGEVATNAETTAETAADAETTTEATRTTVTESAETVQTSAEATRTTVTESAETVRTAAEATRTAAETTQTAADGAAEATTTAIEAGSAAGGPGIGGLPPGLLFFAGGLVVLLALGVARYLRAR